LIFSASTLKKNGCSSFLLLFADTKTKELQKQHSIKPKIFSVRLN